MRQNKSRWRKITIQSQGILLQIQFQCLSVQRQFTAGLDCCAILVCNFMLTIFPLPWLSETFIFKGTLDFSFWLLPAWLTSVFPSRTELTWAKQDAALHLLCPRTLSFCSQHVKKSQSSLVRQLLPRPHFPLPAEMQSMGKFPACFSSNDTGLDLHLDLQQHEGHSTYCKAPLPPPPSRQALLWKADPHILLTDLLSCATSWDLPPLCRRTHLPSALLEGRTKGSLVISLAQGCTGCEQKNWRWKPGFMPPGPQLNKHALLSFPQISQEPITIEL